MMASAKWFSNYVRNYILCCFFPDQTYNPAVFEENHIRYHACFGAFHVKKVLPKLIILKTLLLLILLLYEFILSKNSLLRLCALVGFFIAATANVVLLIGVLYKRYAYFIPYFFTYVLLAFLLILLLFVNFLDTANTKDTLVTGPLLHNLSLLLILIFEVYTILLTWRMFVYICDVRMDEEITAKERSRRVRKNRRCLDPTECVPIKLHISAEPDALSARFFP